MFRNLMGGININLIVLGHIGKAKSIFQNNAMAPEIWINQNDWSRASIKDSLMDKHTSLLAAWVNTPLGFSTHAKNTSCIDWCLLYQTV